MFILFLSVAFAAEPTANVVDANAVLAQLPCNVPTANVTILDVNAVKPSIFGNRRFMMEAALERDRVQGEINRRCTTAQAEAYGKVVIAQATADALRTGKTLTATAGSGGTMEVATGDAALPDVAFVGYWGGYGFGHGPGAVYAATAVGTNAEFLRAQRRGSHATTAASPTATESKEDRERREKEAADSYAARMGGS